MSTCISSIILSMSTIPIKQTQSNIPKPYSKLKFFKTHQKLKIQEFKGYKYEILWEKWKTHTFSWRLMKRWWRKWRIFVRTRWVCERGRQWTVTMCEGKLKFFWKTNLKNNPHYAKHTIFATGLSHKQVAKITHQKPWWQNLEKLF